MSEALQKEAVGNLCEAYKLILKQEERRLAVLERGLSDCTSKLWTERKARIEQAKKNIAALEKKIAAGIREALQNVEYLAPVYQFARK